jgi:hypothetical protein
VRTLRDILWTGLGTKIFVSELLRDAILPHDHVGRGESYMKGEARLLLEKAADSLLLGIEKFNCPFERGRVAAVLIFLDHAFEMLLKASILQRGRRIRKRGASETLGFDECVRAALSDAKVKFLSEEQTLILQMLNGLRDAAQHHLITIEEAQLYIHAQSAVTLFRDLLKSVFGLELLDYLPRRVLPISTQTPVDLSTLFESETSEIRKLLNRRRKARVEIDARLRPLAIVEATIRGKKTQPSRNEIHKLEKQLRKKRSWKDLFPGVSQIEISPLGTGASLSLRLTKKTGIPVVLVPEGTPGASVVAVKRVDELGFYNLGAKQLASKVGLTTNKVVAAIRVLKIDQDPIRCNSTPLTRRRFANALTEHARRVQARTVLRLKVGDLSRPSRMTVSAFLRMAVHRSRIVLSGRRNARSAKSAIAIRLRQFGRRSRIPIVRS